MRLVFVLPGFSRKPIGGYRVVYEYCNQLVERGWDVRISYSTTALINQRRDAVLRRVESHLRNVAVRAIYRWFGTAGTVNWFQLDRRVRTTASFSRFRRWVNESTYVVGTEVSTWDAARRTASARSDKRPTLLVQHYEEWAASTEYIDGFFADSSVRKIAISDWLVDEVERCGGVARLIPNAVDAGDFPKGRPLVSRPNRVLALISTAPDKRADVLLDVFRSLESKGVELTTFGVRPLPVGAPEGIKHHLQPSREELSKLMRESRVFLCTSDREGWGLPPAEALLSGCALVSTRNGGVDGYASGAGLFADAGDVDGLRQHVDHLLADTELAQRLVNIGQEKLLAYTPRAAANLLVQALTGGDHES